MKVLFFILILLIFSITTEAGEVNDFQLKNINHEQVSFEELKGDKLTILDFWATWCKPCIKSIPALKKIHNEFKEQGVSLIGINIDSPRNKNKVKPFVNSLGIDYPILLDKNNELISELGITAIPALLFLDAQGKILFSHEGFKSGDEKTIRKEIIEILKGIK